MKREESLIPLVPEMAVLLLNSEQKFLVYPFDNGKPIYFHFVFAQRKATSSATDSDFLSFPCMVFNIYILCLSLACTLPYSQPLHLKPSF